MKLGNRFSWMLVAAAVFAAAFTATEPESSGHADALEEAPSAAPIVIYIVDSPDAAAALENLQVAVITDQDEEDYLHYTVQQLNTNPGAPLVFTVDLR